MGEHQHETLEDAPPMRELRDRLLKITERHEKRDHDGEPCIDFRCNAVAYLAHCVGLHQPHLPRVSELLEIYEIDHHVLAGPHPHG